MVGWSLRNQISLRPEGKRLTNRVHGGGGGGSKSTVNVDFTCYWPQPSRTNTCLRELPPIRVGCESRPEDASPIDDTVGFNPQRLLVARSPRGLPIWLSI